MSLKKKHFVVIACALLLLAFIVLLIQKDRKIQSFQNHIDDLASICIKNAWKGFSDYLQDPSERNYVMGMDAFYAFYILYPDTSRYKDYFGEVVTHTYDTLLNDDRVDITDIQRLVDALEVLADDYSNITGYSALRRFKKNPLLE